MSLREADSQKKTQVFAGFLARRADWTARRTARTDVQSEVVGLAEGREVERDGGRGWEKFVVNDRGEGAGWVDDGVDVSHSIGKRFTKQLFECDGNRLSIVGTITLNSGRAASVEVTEGLKDVVVGDTAVSCDQLSFLLADLHRRAFSSTIGKAEHQTRRHRSELHTY